MPTDKQLHILRHSLGLTRSKEAYRNHFVTGEGSDDHPDCMALVQAGLMIRRPGNVLSGGDDIFCVTDAGKAAAGVAPALPVRHCGNCTHMLRNVCNGCGAPEFKKWGAAAGVLASGGETKRNQPVFAPCHCGLITGACTCKSQPKG